jgi:hypothetical protein
MLWVKAIRQVCPFFQSGWLVWKLYR